MNAFTSSDHTSYPFATTNRQDFDNLMSVYLDATLHPLLDEKDFAQEGWRIGPENPLAITDGQSDGQQDGQLVFKGVVYNEMKGQMSDASYLYYIRFQECIFPDIHNSGGDPHEMTNLTYKNLKDFHLKNYHPSNAKLFTYGDMPLADHLQGIDSQLRHFKRMEADNTPKSPLDLETGPLNFTISGPLDSLMDETMQHKTSVSWLMGDTSNVLENFSLGIISSLLLDGYGSPLYQALIEAGLGPEFSPNTGFDSAGRIGIFSVGLNGVKGADVPNVKKAIELKLQDVHARGFDDNKVAGILHQLELSLKHKTANFGMNLMQRVQPGWFNGVDPFDALAWDDIVNGFRQKLAIGGYLEGLLEKYLLNDRTLTFTMTPSPTHAENLVAEENSRLAEKIAEVTDKAGGKLQAYKQLKGRELDLLQAQSKACEEELDSLPTLHVVDVPRETAPKKIRDSIMSGVGVQWHEASTNGLTYFRAIHELQHLPTELRMLIPLFTDSIMRLGTRSQSMEQLEDLIKLKTGGISLSYHKSALPMDFRSSVEGIAFSGYSLDANVPSMYELLRVLIQETDFDSPQAESNLRQLLQADASGALDTVAGSGHSYARNYAESGLSSYGLLNEQVGGLTQIQQIADLASRTPMYGLKDVLAKLKAIQQFALSNLPNLRVALTCGHESVLSNEKALDNFLSRLPSSNKISTSQSEVQSQDFSPMTFFPLPYQVSYAALSVPTVGYLHSDSAPLQILSQLLTHKHLHHEVREKGGAYGGGAYARGLSGMFGFYSYRDPNPQNTIRIMQNAGQWAFEKEWSARDLNEAKLSTFQGIDAPQGVDQEGMTKFVSGIDQDMEQRRREQLLDVTENDVREVAQRYLVNGMRHARMAVLGEKKDWVNAEAGWTTKKIELSKTSEIIGASDLGRGDLDPS